MLLRLNGNSSVPKLWLSLLSLFLVALLLWSVLGLSETQHRIAILAIVGVVLTAMSSVFTIVINNKEAREREIRLLIQKEQQKVFEHFYVAFFEILKATKDNKKNPLTKNVIHEMYEFKRGLMSWGSEKLIADYLQYETEMTEASSDGISAVLKVGDKFLKSMRKELGFEDKGTVNIMSIILDVQARKDLTK